MVQNPVRRVVRVVDQTVNNRGGRKSILFCQDGGPGSGCGRPPFGVGEVSDIAHKTFWYFSKI